MKFSKLLFLLIILGLVLVYSGCRTTGYRSEISSKGSVTRLNFSQITSYISKDNGKPLLVNFWATWCEPCVEELPDLIRLHQEYHDKGLRMVGFSVDFPDELENTLIPFVKNHKIPYPVYLADPENQDQLISYISPDWFGAVPATFLYDSNGRLVNKKVGRMDYREMREFIKPVLNQ